MSIVIKEADGTIRHPFGEFETLEEKAERLEKELQASEQRVDLLGQRIINQTIQNLTLSSRLDNIEKAIKGGEVDE